jgi:hypothetical protein
VNATAQQIGAWIARIGAVAMVVLAAVPSDSLPLAVRPYFAIAGAVIVAVDRYVTDPSTGNPTTPPAPMQVQVANTTPPAPVQVQVSPAPAVGPAGPSPQFVQKAPEA